MITAVTTCMGRLEHLETTLPLMLEEFDHAIVVDYSCPQKSGDFAEKEGAEVIRRPGEKYWNASKARNLGAKAVRTEQVCFIDADVMPLPGLQLELKSLISTHTMALASRRPDGTEVDNLAGFIGLELSQFWRVGGYNEELEGYGLEDGYLRAQLAIELGMGCKRVMPALLAVIRHSHEMRSKFIRGGLVDSARLNSGLLTKYLASKGISEWLEDPRTAEIAYRTHRI